MGYEMYMDMERLDAEVFASMPEWEDWEYYCGA